MWASKLFISEHPCRASDMQLDVSTNFTIVAVCSDILSCFMYSLSLNSSCYNLVSVTVAHSSTAGLYASFLKGQGYQGMRKL